MELLYQRGVQPANKPRHTTQHLFLFLILKFKTITMAILLISLKDFKQEE